MATSVYLGGGGGGTPATPTNSIQFNNAGAFGGDSALEWNVATAGLTAGTATPTVLMYNFSGTGDDPLFQTHDIETTVTHRAASSPNYGEFNTGTSIQATFAPTGSDPGFNIYSALVVQGNTPNTTTGDVEQANAAIFNMNYNGPTGAGVIGIQDSVHSFVDGFSARALLATTQTEGVISNHVSGLEFDVVIGAASSTPKLYGIYSRADVSGTVTNLYQVYTTFGPSGTTTNWFAYYAEPVGGNATNAYDFWANEQGVFRIKADDTFDAVFQGIPALYNPQFTKYTPGAADFERISLSQWNGNVAEVGTQSGGSGVLRKLRANGSSFEVKPFRTGQPTTATTLAAGAAGAVTNGAHLVAVTYLAGSGETTISPTATITIASNDRINLSNIPTGNTFVTDRNIYISKAGETDLHLVTNVGDNTTTTFVFNAADATLVGAAPPGVNSTGLVQVSVAPTEIDLIGGSPSNGAGAPITLTAGDGSGSNAGGSIVLTAGGSGSGTPGDITLATSDFIKMSGPVLFTGNGTIGTDVTNGNSLIIRVWDINDATYRNMITATTGNTPDITFNPSGGTITVQASTYKSSDGSTGVSAGPFTTISSITVKNGLVTALTGS